ncbi:MAG: hypothetical protein Q9174_005356 [Haloplaca sp. 1 TL-2023]
MQRALEELSPQLCEADKELWLSFIMRDIPNWEEKLVYPKNPKSWYKVYRMLRKQYDQEVQDDAAKLKAAFTGIKSEKDKHQSRVMEGTPHIPKIGGMEFAHAAEYNRIKKPPPRDTRPRSSITFMGGSKTKTLTPKGVLDKSLREAREMDRFRKSHSLSVPTHQLNHVASKVLVAPPGRIQDFRQAAIPQPVDPSSMTKASPLVIPRRQGQVTNAPKPAPRAMTHCDKERRLLALRNGKSLDASPEHGTDTDPSTVSASRRERPSAVNNAGVAASRTKSSPSTSSKPASVATSAVCTPATQTSSVPKSETKAVSKSTSASATEVTVPAVSSPVLTGGKRKAEDSPLASVEHGSAVNPELPTATTLSPPRRKRLTLTPEATPVRRFKKKAEVDIFIPAKKRRVVS